MGLVIWVTDIFTYPAANQTCSLIGQIPASLADFLYERCWASWWGSHCKYVTGWGPLGEVVTAGVVVCWLVQSVWPPLLHYRCQYFLKWPPVCSRTEHRGPVTPLFGFKTWKHKEQKATNWTKYFRSRKVFRLEIRLNIHLLGSFVQV